MATTNSSPSLLPDNWIDLFQSDQPLDMDSFLQSDLLAPKRSFNMKISIAHIVSGSISFVASMLLVTHILRSHECLSSTYHRLIFGLSVADMVSSFCFTLSSTMVSKEMSYLIPFASGNIATCDAQGFLVNFTIGVSMSYNCCICFYYLAIITYNKKFEYIEKKLEPWFHGISILFPLVICVILFATNAYNGSGGGVCYGCPYAPPHCIGYEAGDIREGYRIPCGRGGPDDGQVELRRFVELVALFWLLILAPVIILVTMVNMFRSVAKVENQIQRYGVSALRLRTQTTTNNNNSADQKEARGFALRLKQMGNYLSERPSLAKSNKMKSQKRAVLHMAFGYSGAWLLVWTAFFVYNAFLIFTKSVPDTVFLLTVLTFPLQGFFNFVVFMAPKLRNTRTMAKRAARTPPGDRSSDDNNQNQQHHLTWFQAFNKAYMDRDGWSSRGY